MKQLDQMDQMKQFDQMKQLDQMKQFDQMKQLDQLKQFDQMKQLDQLKQIEITKRIEFACLLERLQKKIDIRINSDIVGKIYDIYDGTYENYTLFELINKLLENKIRITCPWNKKMIIEMIQSEGLYIPKKYEPMERTNWKLIYRDCCLKCNSSFTISNHDIIRCSFGNLYQIMITQSTKETVQGDYEDDVCLYLYSMSNANPVCFFVKTSDDILDYEDITIITNKDKGLREGPYENYTLIELLHILKEKNIEIACYWNKNAIIEMIKKDEQKFGIPKKYDPLQPSTWKYDRHRITTDSFRYDYLTVTSNSYGAFFEFTESDLIKLTNGKIYEIEITKYSEYNHVIGKEDIIYVYMYCIDTAEEKYIYAEEFVKMLDYEDVTIIRNKGARYNLY
jgi:hypothetical protein